MLFIYDQASLDLQALRQYLSGQINMAHRVSWPLLFLGVRNIYEVKFSLRVQNLEENHYSDPFIQYKEQRYRLWSQKIR